MTYWVYENYPTNKAVVHRATCSYCKNGLGLHKVGNVTSGKWHGPYSDAASARDKANRTGRADVRDCKVCSP